MELKNRNDIETKYAQTSGQNPQLNTNNNSKIAFTLAEVLITLGIIGVVAALTVPMLMNKIQTKIKIKRNENIIQKLSKVTDKMASLEVLQGWASTHDFVYEMKKHLSIAKICENDNLAECWPTPTVDVGDGKTWDISLTQTCKKLKTHTLEGDNWDRTMGIVTSDGTSMIISYNKSCNYDINKNGLKFDKATGMSSTLTSRCLSIIYDWNGSSRPNKLGDDVLALGEAGGLGDNCAYRLNNLCIATKPHNPTPITKAECQEAVTEGKLGIKACSYDHDLWAGAVKECGGIDKMFTLEEIGEIAASIYEVNGIGAEEEKTGVTFNVEKALALGLPDVRTISFFRIWSGQELDRLQAYSRSFGFSGTNTSPVDYRTGWNTANYFLLCKGD